MNFEHLKREMNDTASAANAALKTLLATRDPDYAVIVESMEYSVTNGGKRIRPFLVMQFARLAGGDPAVAMQFACALEMIHTYSLIHDDLPCMDDDDLRRGKPTNHKVYGEAIATLAGDALLTYAFDVATLQEIPADAALRAVRILSREAGVLGMIGGQVLDMIGETKKHDFPMLLKMNRLKTGALIRAAALLGLASAGEETVSSELLQAAEVYTENIGIAFQVIDDVLDVTGDVALLGKPILSDQENEKSTFLSFMTPEEAKKYAADLTDKAIAAIRDYPGAEILCELALYLLSRDH